MTRPAERVVTFYNQRCAAEQWIKEGKNAVEWTRLSCHRFVANAVRLQLHVLAYNLANFPAHTGFAGGCQALVADHAARAVGQDRRPDRSARRGIACSSGKSRLISSKLLVALTR
jgi:hypothetical protein